MSCEVLLEFHGEIPELTRTIFRANGGEVRSAIRGKTPGARRNAGTFQWSSAVRAVSLLLAKAALMGRGLLEESNAALRGSTGSSAASLDYAISKQPGWIVDMFGMDGSGHSRIRRLIRRSNAERKYPGPVVLGINTLNISPTAIDIWWNDARVVDSTILRTLIDHLERQSGDQTSATSAQESPEAFFLRRAHVA